MKFLLLRAYAVLGDADAALSLLEELSKGALSFRHLVRLKTSPEFAFISTDPRAVAAFAAAEERLAGESANVRPPAP